VPPAEALREEPSKQYPALRADGEAAEVVKALGYDEAYVFRWQNSAVDGWVEFDSDGGPKRVSLGETREASRPNVKPVPGMDPRRISGFLVVAMRKEPAAEGEERYEVRVEQGFKYDGCPAQWDTFRGGSHVGKVKLWSKKDLAGVILPRQAHYEEDSSVSLQKYVEGKPVNWLELRIADSSD